MDDSKLSILTQYLRRGWSLVPLHDVSAGQCSCRRNCGGSAGKHPIEQGWQTPASLVRDDRALIARMRQYPNANWGVATGPASGVWVLDVDPGSGGEVAFATLWGELRAAGETLPETLTLGPTGGGGRHLVFALPPGVEIHGSQTKNRYGLLPGLDVRGIGGQIVVAPSVSGKGAYGAVLVDLPPATVGPTLTARLTRGLVGAAAGPGDPRMPLGDPGPTGPSSGGTDGGPAGGLAAARYRAYAGEAVRRLLDELAGAEVGTRNDTAFRVACRLVELANAPWSGFDVAEVWGAWYAAAEDHPGGVRVPAAELDGVWRRAVLRVGEVAADPPSGDGWYGVGGEVIPFSSISPAAGSVNGGGGPGVPAAGAQATVLDDHAAAAGPPTPADPVQALIDQMLTPEQLRLMPAPEPLVNGVLDLETCAWLIGAPGSYKSFVALDLAAHVGRGEAWRGHAVRQGLVLYVAGEGTRGMRLRVDAWEREYGPVKDVRVLPMPVQADERRVPTGHVGAWSVLVEAARRLQPVMIIIDTQARMTIGLNENDNTEMSYFADQADRLKRACGACVLIVHHTGRAGANARGASSIDGAQDAELRLERKGLMRVELHMDKQKDQAEEPPTTILLRRSEGGADPRTGRDLSSLVLVHEGADDPFSDPGTPVNKQQMRAIALFKLIEEYGNRGEGLTRADIRKLFMDQPEIAELNTGVRNKAWLRAWNGDKTFPGLIARGLIAKRAGAERFKVIIVPDQSDEGVLTRNPTDGTGTPPPTGWNLHLPDDEH